MATRTVELERIESVSKAGKPYTYYVIHMTQKVAGVEVPVVSDRLFPRFVLDLRKEG